MPNDMFKTTLNTVWCQNVFCKLLTWKLAYCDHIIIIISQGEEG